MPAVLLLSFAVVMGAAAAPLWRAAGVAPMQAIRETSLLRARKRLRVKPRQIFDVPALLASRHLRLYKSRQVGVGLLVAISLLIITLGWVGLRNALWITPPRFEYEIYRTEYYGNSVMDRQAGARLLSEADLAQVKDLPYVGEVRYAKEAYVNLLLDKVSPYLTHSSLYDHLIADERDIPSWWNHDFWAYERRCTMTCATRSALRRKCTQRSSRQWMMSPWRPCKPG